MKNLEILVDEKLFDRSRDVGELVVNDLTTLLQNHPYVGNVR